MHREQPGCGMNRRSFLETTSLAGAGMLAAPSLLAAEKVQGANDRIRVGLIGVGGRGSDHLHDIAGLAQAQNVEITALCDVWKPNLDRAAAAVKKRWANEPARGTRFRDLLARPDVDAVVIATPDFSHGPILVAALEAGKDVYVEKPMSIDLEAANRALELARAKNRVVQAGTQRRSDGAHLAAAKLLATGVLGHISRVTAEVDFNEPRWARPYKDCKPQDVDWEAYLGGREPFDPRLLRRWHLYRACSNGLSGLWMSHYVDALHMLTAARYPATAVAHGGVYVWKEDRQHADTFHALLDYPEGFLFSWAMGLGNSAGQRFTIHGTEGTFDAEQWTLSRQGGRAASKVPAEKVKAEKGVSHMANWLECLRSRGRPNADIQYGHQHAVATILAAAAYESGRRQKYDPQARQIAAG
ncbi:MAG: Gfo/Idh/MocA family oxidoreductase [Thermoguttaceae bacterium]